MSALRREEYLLYGVIPVLSAYQGSHGPAMFAAPIAD